jgi:DnaJ-class molecular chaperone
MEKLRNYSRIICERLMNERFTFELCAPCDGTGYIDLGNGRSRVQPCVECGGTGAVEAKEVQAQLEERELAAA